MSKPRTKGEKLDRENVKRKAVPSPRAAKTGSGPRASKIRKPNPTETTVSPMQVHTQGPSQIQTQFQTQAPAQSNERPRNSHLVQKLVAAWMGGSQSQHPLMTQEDVRESIALRDSQQQCSEAESMIQMFQQKVKAAETVIGNLKNSLKVEGKEKMDLVDKMNATGALTATISDHINYITDTLARCQQHKSHLSNLYNCVIMKQKEDYARLKNNEDQRQKHSTNLQIKVTNLEKQLEKSRYMDEIKFNQMQREYEAEYTKIREDYENSRKRLEALATEKNEISARLANEKKTTVDLEKKINEYDNEMKKLTEKLSQVSGNLQSLKDEKRQCEVQLVDKDKNFRQIVEELESATSKIMELSAEISTINNIKSELEEKIKFEVNEREIMSKSLTSRIEDLMRQTEHLRNSKKDAINEMERSKEQAVNEVQRSKEEVVIDMQRKVEIAEREIQSILAETKSRHDELVNKYERLLKLEVEKYDNCVADIKTMEARHKSELSRTNSSSSTILANANAEKRQMERELDTLRREKDRLEVQCRQAEDLLQQHTKSEKLLQKQLDQAQSDVAKFANAAAIAAAEKKRVDEEKQQKVCKIKELEQELLNLQFNAKSKSTPLMNVEAKSTSIDTLNTEVTMDIDRRVTERVTKPKIVSTAIVKKSILKRASNKRKTRSTPPSPSLPPPTPADKKMITFDLDSSDSSPVKLNNSASVNKFINSETLFDEMISVGKSSSQPMQASLGNSQTSMSQISAGGRKFFKSHYSQSK